MGVQAPPRKNVERIPPRRRTVKRSVWRRTIWPLVKFLTLVALVVLAAQAVIGKALRPINLLHREYSETRRVQAELESLKRENAELERQIKYLRTGRGTEQAARRLGYVKPGEIPLVLPDESVKQPASDSE